MEHGLCRSVLFPAVKSVEGEIKAICQVGLLQETAGSL